MEEIILFQGDSVTDAGRDRNSDNFAGQGYPTMIKGQLGAAFPGKYLFENFKGSFYAVFKYVCFYPVSNAQVLITV